MGRHAAGPVCRGKASMVSQEMAKRRDAAQRKAKPNLFFDSYRHIDRVRDNLAQDPEFSCKLKPSMSAPSVSQIAASCAGTSTYIALLKKQWGVVSFSFGSGAKLSLL